MSPHRGREGRWARGSLLRARHPGSIPGGGRGGVKGERFRPNNTEVFVVPVYGQPPQGGAAPRSPLSLLGIAVVMVSSSLLLTGEGGGTPGRLSAEKETTIAGGGHSPVPDGQTSTSRTPILLPANVSITSLPSPLPAEEGGSTAEGEQPQPGSSAPPPSGPSPPPNSSPSPKPSPSPPPAPKPSPSPPPPTGPPPPSQPPAVAPAPSPSPSESPSPMPSESPSPSPSESPSPSPAPTPSPSPSESPKQGNGRGGDGAGGG